MFFEESYCHFINQLTDITDTSCYFEELHFVVLSTLVKKYKNNSVFTTADFFPKRMATLRNKWKFAAVGRETQKEHPRNGNSRNTSVPWINGEYIKQIFEEIENRVTEKLSPEFSRSESRILGALFKLDEVLLNLQLRTHSGTFPGTSRNTDIENQEPNGVRSLADHHPEVASSVYQSHHSVDSDSGDAPLRYSLLTPFIQFCIFTPRHEPNYILNYIVLFGMNDTMPRITKNASHEQMMPYIPKNKKAPNKEKLTLLWAESEM